MERRESAMLELPRLVDDAAVDDGHQDRQVEEGVGVGVDGVGREPGQVGAIAGFDAAGDGLFRMVRAAPVV